MDIFIYALIDPITDDIKYIGKTSNPKRRYTQHISTVGEKNQNKTNWINSLISNGLLPKMIILETCNHHEWKNKERYWIKKFRDSGCDLLNITDGGDDTSELWRYETAKILAERGFRLTRCFSCGNWTAKTNRICTTCLRNLSNNFNDEWYLFYKKDIQRTRDFIRRHYTVDEISFSDMPKKFLDALDL